MSGEPRSYHEAAGERELHHTLAASHTHFYHEQASRHDLLHELQGALRQGVAARSVLWSFKTRDWVVGVQAADIDNDGDIEVLVASRDGYVRALTRWGAVKWERRFAGLHLSAIVAVPAVEAPAESAVRIVIGTRNGKVLALDANGARLENWAYETKRMIRQICIYTQYPGYVVVGSEDRCIHVLDIVTGKLCWKHATDGWIRCVFCCDVDGDGEQEILGGSGDRHLYILNGQGDCLYKLYTGHQIYAIFAAPLEPGGPVHIITSSNRKDLTAWIMTAGDGGYWRPGKAWEKSPGDRLFENRVHSIYVKDINNDHSPEILVGSEDGHLYILDQQGTLLWKQDFDSCVYDIFAADIDFDGQCEILAGTESDGLYAFHLEITANLYKLIEDAYEKAVQIYDKGEILKELLPRERVVLRDLMNDVPPEHHIQMEMDEAERLMAEESYEAALSIFLRLLQDKVQYCWSRPRRTHGYIWSECFGNVIAGTRDQIIVGTDEGYIYAFDSAGGADKPLWTQFLGDRVRMIRTGIKMPDGFDSMVAVLANHRMVMLDHHGRVIKEHTFADKSDWARCVYISKSGHHTGQDEIIIGLENNKISIWDAELRHEITTINTPQGIGVVCTGDIAGEGTAEIISGSINNQVYVHTRQGQELWRFETEDRVQALHVEDIDKDGRAEVIVGSEDRNVYVLDHEGHLKWRYRTLRGVMDVDVCDIRLENDPEDASERKWKVLVSSSDSYLYVLNAYGDLIWKYQSSNRIRTVRARDLNDDGRYEIAIASENQLDLLQILNRRELFDKAQTCWHKLLEDRDLRSALMKLTYHPDEYIRSFALARLAGQYERHEEDFKRLQQALKDEDSLQVRREMVRSIVSLCRVPYHHDENTRQARQLLQQLSADPEQEIRLAIVDVLPLIMKVQEGQKAEEGLCFEYLEYFTHNVDTWVRRSVVRKLDDLVKDYSTKVFKLLLKTATDEDEWVRQESGRTLAHYFDAHPELLVRDMLALLYSGTNVAVLQQISYSARIPAIRRAFQVLVKQLTGLSAENIAAILDETIAAIKEANKLGPFYGEELLQIYEEFRQIWRTKTIDAIARYQRITRSDMLNDISGASVSQIMRVFDELQRVVGIMRVYGRREAMGDRVTSLIDATDALDRIRNELSQFEMRQTQKRAATHRLPEHIILSLLLEQWSTVIKKELRRLRGEARLVLEIRNKEVRPEEEVVISVCISNQGRSPADNVRVTLEKSSDFDIVGSDFRTLTEVSTSNPAVLDFTIRPHVTAPRLNFQLTYDDAERWARQQPFSDIVFIKGYQRPYRPIPNPYTSGTPIRDKDMFYGREEDLETLREKLKSVTANKVVVLSGQRRMGKTSLVYRLASELAEESYAPVLIDLQALAIISNAAQLLEGFASRICEEVQHYRGVSVPGPDAQAFVSNPTAAFNDTLTRVLEALPGYKLVFLLDEFEILQERMQGGYLNQDVLSYLRSLMQHRQRLNFLLVGTPRIRHITDGYWATFFNIALQHHLSKMKPEEATALITEPIHEYLEYDPLALERVHLLTGDQPYLIHLLSERLIVHCNKLEKSYVSINDVNAVLDYILEQQTSSIQWIWGLASPTGKFILSLLAQEKGEEGRVFTMNDIREEFDVQGIPYEKKAVTEALEELRREDIIEARLDGTQFRIPVGLTKEWLRRAKPPERVVREELLNDD